MIKASRLERKTFNLLGVDIDVLDTDSLGNTIIELTDRDSPHSVMYVNADCMLIARKQEVYRRVLNTSDLVYADGVGIVYGAKLWGLDFPGRSTAADFMPDFCKQFAKKGLRLYFLGATDGVAEKAAAKLRKEIPDLMIVGTQHGYFPQEQEEEIIATINDLKPDILLVGFGAPRQEFWINDHKNNINATVIWGVGGLFDFLSGTTRRGPQLLLDHGFEWLCRLVTEPQRLWRRYLIGNTKFVFYLLWDRFFKRGAINS